MPDKDEIMSICHIFANFGVIIHDNMEYRRLTEAEYNDLAGRIIYEDNHILVINKRAGEIVQGDKTGDEPLGETYKAFIAQRDGKPGKVFLGVPHRLDRPVSGLTILAKTSKALERLSAMFREGQVHKTYWALVCSRPDQDSALLEDWLVRNEKMNKSFVCAHPEGRKDARLAKLRYRILCPTERYCGTPDRPPSPDQMPACSSRGHHQGRPQIRGAALQQGRQHLPDGPARQFHSPGEEDSPASDRSGPFRLEWRS